MSTISVGPSGAATVPAKAMISVRRGSLAAFAAAGLLVAIGAGLLLATSDHLVDPTAFGLQMAVTVVGWFSAALYWLVRRPGNRLGLFLLALAVAMAASRFRERPSRFSAASVCWPTSVFFFSCFTSSSRSRRVVFRVAWDGRFSARYRSQYWSSSSPGSSSRRSSMAAMPLAGCNAACPANGFMIADRPTLADGFLRGDISAYYLFAVCSARFVFLIYRLATATRPRRRALLPVYVPALMAIAPVVVFHGSPRRAGATWMRARTRVGLAGQHRLQRTAIRFSAFDRGEHVLRRDGVEKDRLPPGGEPERLSAAHDAGRCTR